MPDLVMSSTLAGCDIPLGQAHDLALLDLDGVVYIGPDEVPGAVAALTEASAAGLRLAYVTNNASRPPQQVADHLVRLGLRVTALDVVTSAQVAAGLLAADLPAGSAVLVVGGIGLYEALAEAGLRGVGSVEEGAVAVVQGFGPDVGWRLLAEGTRAVRSGLPWVATNLDPTVPTPFGPAPGNGTLVTVIATAAGRRPDRVAGKPSPEAFLAAARRCAGTRPLVIGDRLDTDLQGARAAGMPGLLVLTGVSLATDLLSCAPAQRPDYVGLDLSALLIEHPPTVVDDSGAARCRQASVEVRDGAARVLEAAGEAVDLLRAGAVACWRAQDAGAGLPDIAELLSRLTALAEGAAWAR